VNVIPAQEEAPAANNSDTPSPRGEKPEINEDAHQSENAVN
jgi:hypothetical protein